MIFPNTLLNNKFIELHINNINNNNSNFIYNKDVECLKHLTFANDVIISVYVNFLLACCYVPDFLENVDLNIFEQNLVSLLRIKKNGELVHSKATKLKEKAAKKPAKKRGLLLSSDSEEEAEKSPKMVEEPESEDQIFARRQLISTQNLSKIQKQYEADEVSILSTYFWSHEFTNQKFRQKMIRRLRLLEKNLILIPVNNGHHWYLLGIRNLQNYLQSTTNQISADLAPKIECFCMNSLGSYYNKSGFTEYKDQRQMETFMNEILLEAKESYPNFEYRECIQQIDENLDNISLNESHSRLPSSPEENIPHQKSHKIKEKQVLILKPYELTTIKTPQQPNGWKCGYFLCMNIENLLCWHDRHKHLTEISFQELSDSQSKPLDFLSRVYYVFKVLKLVSDSKNELKTEDALYNQDLNPVVVDNNKPVEENSSEIQIIL